MSLIIGDGLCISYMESDVQCPICLFKFNADDKIEKSKYPVFKMKCPGCKSWIGISLPIFGGKTTCFEWNPPKVLGNILLKIETPNRVNGKIVVKKRIDDDYDDDESGEESMSPA